MLCFGVLLLVTSAFTAPSGEVFDYINAELVPNEEFGIVPNTGRADHLTDGLFSLIDGGDTAVNVVAAQHIVTDVASLKGYLSQGLALGQALGIVGGLATGGPGDACQYAEIIDAYLSGNYRQELKNFVIHIAQNLDRLAKLKLNPQSARYSVGPRSGCSGGGRIYQFEPAWEVIIANASPEAASYINEEYCTAKRLYYGFDVRSNIEGAAITAYSLPPVARIMTQSRPALANFITALISNGDISSALHAAKQSLFRSV